MKTHTDFVQSKKLAKILPIESADMFWYKDSVIKEVNPRVMNYTQIPELQSMYYSPCWSLSALLEVLPKIHKLKPLLDLEENSIMYSGTDIYIFASNPIDACYETILKLHELNLL